MLSSREATVRDGDALSRSLYDHYPQMTGLFFRVDEIGELLSIDWVAARSSNNDVWLDGEGNLTVDGDQDHRVFSVPVATRATLTGITVTRGRAELLGGGIYNEGNLFIEDCEIVDTWPNPAQFSCGKGATSKARGTPAALATQVIASI